MSNTMLTPGLMYWPFSVATVVFHLWPLFFMQCALSCIVLTVGWDVGDGNPPSSCSQASAFTASSIAVLCPLKFLVSVAGKVPHGQVELGTDISGYCAAHFFHRSKNLVYFCTVDLALDNRNVCGTLTASSCSLGCRMFSSSCMTPTTAISTCDGREKTSHVTGYIDIEFIIRVGWVGLQPASHLTLTTLNNWCLPAV